MKLKVFFLSIIMIFITTGVTFADEIIFNENGLRYDIVEVTGRPSFAMFSVPNQTIEEYFAEQFAKHTERIDIYQYNITLGELIPILSSHYEYMIASGNMKIGIASKDENPIISYIEPYYLFNSPEEDADGRKFIENSVREYADYARSRTDDKLGQLLLVHDKLIMDNTYDHNDSIESYSAYGLFKNKTSVCQGYAEAMYLIAKELGIESAFCNYSLLQNNAFKGHIWNYMRLDGEWYQLDATWDDPTYEGSNGVKYEAEPIHSYFLVTDEVIEEGHYSEDIWHTSFDVPPSCDDAKYMTNHLFNINGPCNIIYNDGYFQTAYNTKIYRSYNTPYTGPIVLSQVYKMSESYMISFYMLEAVERLDIIICTKNNLMLEQSVCNTINQSFSQYSAISLNIPRNDSISSSDKKLEFFVWNVDTMRPLSQKVNLN